jgi:hypothetical protein
MLTAYVNLESTPADIKYQLEADVQSCMREEHFDYDEAQRIIDEFVKDLSAIDPFDLKETEDEGEELGEGCMLFLYVRDDNEEHEFPVY